MTAKPIICRVAIVPTLDAQRWFDSLQARARVLRAAQAEAGGRLDHFLPAMLHEAFG